jgi:hypothetical protein
MAPGKYQKTPLHRTIKKHPVLSALAAAAAALTWAASFYHTPIMGGPTPAGIVEAIDGWGQAANRDHVAPAKPLTDVPGDGTYTVGIDMYPGTWTATGKPDCWWEVLDPGDTSEIREFGYGPGSKKAKLRAGDDFTTISCSHWTLTDPPAAK